MRYTHEAPGGRLRSCAAVLVTLVCAGPAAAAAAAAVTAAVGISTTTPIKHFVFLMQGGRTFDNYFGTYPGADGPPAGTCQPRTTGQPAAGCVKPFPLIGKPACRRWARTADGHREPVRRREDGRLRLRLPAAGGATGATAMGYYDGRDAALLLERGRQLRAVRPLLLVHASTASVPTAPTGCRPPRRPAAPGRVPAGRLREPADDLRPAAGGGRELEVLRPGTTTLARPTAPPRPANPETQTARVPLVDFARFTHDPALASHIVDLDQYYKDLHAGTLPAVATSPARPRITSAPRGRSSPRPGPGPRLVTQLMQSRYWDSSALMWSYDGSGGWYDHVTPPRAGRARPPSASASRPCWSAPYARKGQVNHTVLDYTSALKFIEQNWRVAPLTSRDAQANNLTSAFDFAGGPRPPVLCPPGRSALPPGTVPAAYLPPPTPVTAIYRLYGAAAAIGVLLLAFAAWSPALSARRRAAARARQPGRGEQVRRAAVQAAGLALAISLAGLALGRPPWPGRPGAGRAGAGRACSPGRSPSRSAPSRRCPASGSPSTARRSSPVPRAAAVTEQHNFSAHTLTAADTQLSASGRRYTFVRWAGQRDPDQAFARPSRAFRCAPTIR